MNRVIPCVILQFVYNSEQTVSHDPMYSLWKSTICDQSVQCASIFVACLLYLKPFFDSLESGLLRADDIRRHDNNQRYTFASYSPAVTSKTSSKNSKKEPRCSGSGQAWPLETIKSPITAGSHTKISGLRHSDSHLWEAQSQSSQAGIIKKTTSWSVNMEVSS